MLVPGPRFWSEGPLGERYSSGGGVSINERGTGLQLRASDVRSVVCSSILHDTSEHQAQLSVHIVWACVPGRLLAPGVREMKILTGSFLCDLRASFANFAIKSFSLSFFSFIVVGTDDADHHAEIYGCALQETRAERGRVSQVSA